MPRRQGRTREPYGSGARRHGEWWVPAGRPPYPLVVLVHGGYWRPVYDLALEHPVAHALAAQGFLVWNVEYSPAGTPWPATLLDVAAAYDHAVRDPRVDTARVAVVGHSAGGQLALWLGSRRPGTPGGAPAVPPALVVAQAPVACLAQAHAQHLGDGAVDLFVGGSPTEHPERYAEADPLALLPSPTPAVLLHAAGDDTVPLVQSQEYAAASGARLVVVPGGHFEHLDPGSAAFEALLEALGPAAAAVGG
ncbi:MAG TPA: alpha/beta hydrolase [Mycobacteriales bacterium]|nr:alpha/beta hydrolase [Mycobacteriales bacterium]